MPSACCCGETDTAPLWSGRHNRAGANQYPYEIVRCTSCGLARTTPLPGGGDPASLYVDGYGDEWIRSESEMAAKSRFRLYDLARLCPAPARVLDVGCSAGWMLDMLTEAGYRAEGVEVDRSAVEYGRSRGRTIHHGTIQDRIFVERSWDLLLMSHVLEHLVDLNSIIARVTRLLAPRGVLLIYVPNFLSLPARLLKNKWGFLVPQAHIWQFEPDTLRASVNRASGGLLELTWVRTSTLLEYTETGVWWKTLAKTAALRSSAALGYGDEITAAFRRMGTEEQD